MEPIKETWSRQKKIDPVTGKKISDLTFTEQRAYNQRQMMPRSLKLIQEMKNKEAREKNNKPITDPDILKRQKAAIQGKFISNCLTSYINGDESYKYYSDKTKELVKSIYENAKKGNNSTLTELLNRTEGKVKDVVDVNMSMSDLRPGQEEIEEMDNQFKAIRHNTGQTPQITGNQAAQNGRGDVLEGKAGQTPYEAEKAMNIAIEGKQADSKKDIN